MVCYAPAFQLCSDVTLHPKHRSHEWDYHHAFFVFVLLYGNLGSEGKTDNRNRHVTNISMINAAMLELCMWRHGANTDFELAVCSTAILAAYSAQQGWDAAKRLCQEQILREDIARAATSSGGVEAHNAATTFPENSSVALVY